jgi:hypothetical protein
MRNLPQESDTMIQNSTVFLPLLLSLILSSDRLSAQGSNCHWPIVEGTLSRTVEQSQYQWRAIRISTEQVGGLRTTVFEVAEIIKSPDDTAILVGRKLNIRESIVPTVTGDRVRDKELADSRQPGSAVIMVSSSRFPGDASVLCEADERVEVYLNATAAALKAITDEKARLTVFVPYLASDSDVVANDALDEVVSNGFEGLSAVRDKLPRELIMQRIADPNAFPSQLGNYGVLAGFCGTTEDAALMEARIVILDAEYRHGIDWVMAGYLMIRGESGLTVLEDAKLRARTAKTTDGKEVQLPFYETYALLQALRFIWKNAPDRISAERLRQSMRMLLDRPELSDLAIAELMRWKDWSLHDRLMLMYDDPEFAFPPNRRAIVRYLFESSREKGDVGPEEKSVRPAHALKADELLKMLEEKDPKTLSEVKRFLAPAKK